MRLPFTARSRTSDLELREAQLRAGVEAMRLERIAGPVPLASEPFVGMGAGSSDARNTTEAVKGAAALAIRTIRQRYAGLELGVYVRRFKEGDFEDTPAFDHPLQRLIDNPTLYPDGTSTHNSVQLMGTVVSQLLSLGEAYLYIIHNGAGEPVNLQLAQPGTIEPVSRSGRVAGYKRLSSPGVSETLLKTTDVLRIWSPDSYESMQARGVMTGAAVQINMDAFTNQTWEKFFKFDATPKLVLEADDAQSQPPTGEGLESFQQGWIRKLHRRIGSAIGSPMFSAPGWKIKVLEAQLENASGVAMMTHTRRTVLQAFGVPPSLTGDVVDANRAAAETNRYVFDVNTIEPLTIDTAMAFTNQLASQYVQTNPSIRLIVKYKPFIARDKAFLLLQEQSDIQHKVRSINQVRAAREPSLPSVTWGELPVGTFADVPFTGEPPEKLDLSAFSLEETAQPSETQVAIEAGEEPSVETEADELPEEERSRGSHLIDKVRAHFSPVREWERLLRRDEVWTPRFAQRTRSVMERQREITLERFVESARARAVSDVSVDALFPLDGWDKMFKEVIEPVRTAAFVASGTEALTAITGETFIFNDVAREIVRTQAELFRVFINRTTQERIGEVLATAIDDGIGVGETAKRISSVFDKRIQDARRIAHTEIAGATQAAQIQGYEQSGVVERQMWNTSLDHLVRDSHTIDGQTVPLSGDFTLSDGDRGPAPGSPEFSVGNRVNCRCFVTPLFDGENPLDG